MTANKGKVLLQVQGLEKKFDDNQVLDGITTDICQGEVVAVIGPSGSGKSTFLRSLNLLEVPTGGKILFEGVDITDPKVDINRHRQKIGMVFQQFNLFPHKTVKENIMLAPVTLGLMKEEEASEKAEELLARVGLPDKADAYPDSSLSASTTTCVEGTILRRSNTVIECAAKAEFIHDENTILCIDAASMVVEFNKTKQTVQKSKPENLYPGDKVVAFFRWSDLNMVVVYRNE